MGGKPTVEMLKHTAKIRCKWHIHRPLLRWRFPSLPQLWPVFRFRHTVTWGNTAATAPSGVTATGTPTSIAIYASIPAAQSQPAATYTDAVVATVTF